MNYSIHLGSSLPKTACNGKWPMIESCCFVLCTQLFALCFRAQWCVERFIFLDVISFLCFPAPFCLTFYSIITPFDALKYHVFENIMEN